MFAVSELSPSVLKKLVVERSQAMGLDAIGVTALDSSPQAERLRVFIAAGRHGEMTWMEASEDRRGDPRRLWPQARSAIMIGQSYAPSADPMQALSENDRAVISVYAQGRDYHDVLKGKIKTLASQFSKASGAEVKVFVDTAPLMEKPLAASAGLGWQGKHTNLVSRQHGSWLFLGAILTTAELQPDEASADHCGSCSRCLDVCPTQAFPAPYQLDARRCLAYLSIEYGGHIAKEFRAPMGNRVFGCDDCLAVCPWNKFAEAAREAKYASSLSTDNPPVAEILQLDDPAFRKRFSGTPVKRTGRNRVVRNALIAAGNSRRVEFLPRVRQLLQDPSPLVRAMAVWAIYQIAGGDELAHSRTVYAALETDPAVQREWLSGTGGAVL